MASDIRCCLFIFQIINILFAIAAISLVALVYNDTSINLLEDFDQKYPNITYQNALESSPLFQLYNDEEKYCQCGLEILNNICSEEQIISGCYDISKNNNKALLRYLDQNECIRIQAELNLHKQLSQIFDIGFDIVHRMALGILICMGIILGFDIILNLSSLCSDTRGEIFKGCSGCNTIISFFGGIAEFVLVIILLVNFYKGRTTGEFLDWYENCEESGAFKKNPYFNEIYEELNKIYGHMTAWIILNFASFGLSCILGCILLLQIGKFNENQSY